MTTRLSYYILSFSSFSLHLHAPVQNILPTYFKKQKFQPDNRWITTKQPKLKLLLEYKYKSCLQSYVFFLVEIVFGTTIALTVVVPFYFIHVLFAILHGNGFERILAIGKGDVIEDKMYDSVSLADAGKFFAIEVHFRRSDVGVNGNGGVFAFTLRVAALRQIYRRFFAPVGFIPIIRVFLYLTVESYQAFCVLCKDVGACSIHINGRC